MMNARRWGMVETYHQQRQNLQFQSLHQPGIVTGLGVRVIEPPESAEEGQDYPWIEIQPGVAIDLKGNPIVVAPLESNRSAVNDLTLKYPIQRKPPTGGSVTVYITVSHEPCAVLPKPNREMIREWFRIDEITHPPSGQQIELCRIKLTNPKALSDSHDAGAPGDNQLDFRFRLQARTRPQAIVRAAQLRPENKFEETSDLSTFTLYQRSRQNLSSLMEAIPGLYPALQGSSEVREVLLSDPLYSYDLLHLPDGEVLLQMGDRSLETLKQFTQNGGGLLIETSPEAAFDSIQQRLVTLIPDDAPPALHAWENLPDEMPSGRIHPLRRSPFLFGRLPNVQGVPLQLFNSGSIVLLQGRLSSSWGLADNVTLSREEIRTAQEFGINILYYLWQRRQWSRLMDW